MGKRVVYFIRAGVKGRIKIGQTENLERRFKSLQTASSVMLKLLGCIDDPERSLEKELHLKFAEWRHHGEWFDPNAELLTFISEHAEAPHGEFSQDIVLAIEDHENMGKKLCRIECELDSILSKCVRFYLKKNKMKTKDDFRVLNDRRTMDYALCAGRAVDNLKCCLDDLVCSEYPQTEGIENIYKRYAKYSF